MVLRRFIVKHRLNLSIAALLSTASAGITACILNSIHIMATQKYSAGMMSNILIGAILLFCLLFVNIMSQYVSSILGSQLIANFRVEVARSLIDLNYERFVGKRHVVLGSFTEDIHRIAPLVAMVPSLMYNFIIVLVCSVYLTELSPKLFGILSAGLILPFLVFWGLGKAVNAQFDIMRRAEEGLFEHLRTISDGKKELVLNQRRSDHFSQALLFPAIKQSENAIARGHLYIGLFQAWSGFIIYIVLFSVVYFGRFVIFLPNSTVVPFIVGGLYLTGPLTFLVQVTQQVAPGLASLRHLDRLGLELKADPAPAAPTSDGGNEQFCGWKRIHAAGLRYRFPSEDGASSEVGPISLDIHRGEMVFVVGGNGAGKSTLLLMLCGLLNPTYGNIFVDGVDVRCDIEAYKNLFSGVFSDFFLFRHILGADGNYLPDSRIDSLIRKMQLDGVIQPVLGVLPRIDFSTGQRKRLALLQCLAEDREILFFDEWAAEQDPTFRHYFYSELLPELRSSGKTVIVISHDDRYFHIADRLIRIEGGIAVSEVLCGQSLAPVA